MQSAFAHLVSRALHPFKLHFFSSCEAAFFSSHIVIYCDSIRYYIAATAWARKGIILINVSLVLWPQGQGKSGVEHASRWKSLQ